MNLINSVLIPPQNWDILLTKGWWLGDLKSMTYSRQDMLGWWSRSKKLQLIKRLKKLEHYPTLPKSGKCVSRKQVVILLKSLSK